MMAYYQLLMEIPMFNLIAGKLFHNAFLSLSRATN